MHYSLAWLLDQIEQGKPIKYLFFWGHTQSQEEQIDQSCFSQWFPRTFEVDKIAYPTAEHWMMAEKARLFDDIEILEKILEVEHPDAAKKLGRQVRNFDQTTWEAKRFEIVVQGNIHKFEQHEDLSAFMIQSQNRVLVEASPRDQIWGIGLGKNNPKAQIPYQWRGKNLLGFALMEARDHLVEKADH